MNSNLCVKCALSINVLDYDLQFKYGSFHTRMWCLLRVRAYDCLWGAKQDVNRFGVLAWLRSNISYFDYSSFMISTNKYVIVNAWIMICFNFRGQKRCGRRLIYDRQDSQNYFISLVFHKTGLWILWLLLLLIETKTFYFFLWIWRTNKGGISSLEWSFTSQARPTTVWFPLRAVTAIDWTKLFIKFIGK